MHHLQHLPPIQKSSFTHSSSKSEPKRAGLPCHLSCILSYLFNACHSHCFSSIPLQLLQIKSLNAVNTPVPLQYLITQMLKNVRNLCYYLSIYGKLERKILEKEILQDNAERRSAALWVWSQKCPSKNLDSCYETRYFNLFLVL